MLEIWDEITHRMELCASEGDPHSGGGTTAHQAAHAQLPSVLDQLAAGPDEVQGYKFPKTPVEGAAFNVQRDSEPLHHLLMEEHKVCLEEQ
jgi:hypothetical protein